MATQNEPTWFSNLPTKPSRTPQQRKEAAQTTSTETSTEATAAGLPYIVPQKETDLTKDRLQILRELQTNARDELKTFEGLEVVKTYDQGMRYFATALTVPEGREGDQDLVTLAAKVQDPTGAVMQGDIERYNNVQTALEQLPQRFRDQFLGQGRFSDQTRADIIAFMRNRINTYRAPYAETRANFERRIGQFNAQLEPLGLKPINVDTILPGDPLKLYAPKIEAYDKKLEADRIRAEREAGGPTIDPLMGVPEGMQVAGEDVEGWRYSPETEAELIAYARSPGATAEGYAKLVTEKTVAEGHLAPSAAEDYERTMLARSQDFFRMTPEQRAAVRGGIDYSDIDKAATENAGLIEGIAQSVRNIPESAYQILEGATAIPKDVVLSALEGTRTGTVKTFTDLAMELGQGRFDGPTTQAFAQALEDRYGSLDAIKRTGVLDPLGLIGDLSMIASGGGTIAARLPGAFGKVGSGIAATGRLMDPLSGGIALATEGLPAAYRAAQQRMPGVTTGMQNLPTEILGFPSGTGGAPIREAATAGFERGAAGAPTPRSEAFTTAMREPDTVGDDLITTSREAVANLRQMASNAYTTAMQQFGKNPEPLSIDTVQQRMQKIKPRSYDTWSDRKGPRPADHLAWEQMNNFVEDYAAKAAKDPNLLMPLEMDQFKQDLFDVGSKVGGAYDRDASRIAGNAYNAVRQELVKHDPIYADTMRDYEKAAREAKQLEASFGLAAARGKEPNIESATRKLQAAIGRNNANVGYGQRAGQVERLNELDPTGTIIPTLAGTTLSSWKPRGLNAAVTLGAGIPAAVTNPLALLMAPAFMPRLVGEAAYGAGRAAGTGKRAIDAVTQSPFGEGVAATGEALADLYNKYPTLALAGAQVGTRLQETEAEQARRLAERYRLSAAPVGEYVAPEEQVTSEVMEIAAEQPALDDLTPKYAGPTVDAAGNEVAPAEAPGPKAGDTIVIDNRDAVYDPVAKAYIFVDTNEIARKVMKRGGAVKGYKGGGLLDYLPDAEDVTGFGRSVAEGAMFGYNDNAEALLRAPFDKEARKDELDRIRREQIKYKRDHPYWAGGGELVGNVAAAFVPGTQGLSAARLARMGPKARAAYELALATGQGAAYGGGTMYDDPDSKRDPLAVFASETAGGMLSYPASRAAVAGGRALSRRVPQGAKDFVARKGRELAGSLSVRRPARR